MDMRPKRVLLLENIEDRLDTYARRLRRVDLDVDAAASLEAALRFADARTYEAAVVDLMLEDPEILNTYDGRHLLGALNSLGEGTQLIIFSGQTEPQVSAQIAMEYQIVDYVDKEQLGIEGSKVLQNTVTKAADEAVYPYREASAVRAQLLGRGPDSEIARGRLTSALKPKGGIEALIKAVSITCADLLPLHGVAAAGHPFLRVDADEKVASGLFWSKGVGDAAEIIIRTEDSESTSTGDVLVEQSYTNLRISAYPRPGHHRAEFTGALDIDTFLP